MRFSTTLPVALALVAAAPSAPAAALPWIIGIRCNSPHRLTLLPGCPVGDRGLTVTRTERAGRHKVLHQILLDRPGASVELAPGDYALTIHHDLFGHFDLSLMWQPLADPARAYSFRICADPALPVLGYQEFALYPGDRKPSWQYREIVPMTCTAEAMRSYDYRYHQDGFLRTP